MAMPELGTVQKHTPQRRGMYVLPSLFTAGNIAAGYYALTESIRGAAGDPRAFDHAALAIGFAVMFDGLDGRVARMTNTSSDFGKEFDSLADVITFGVAPSLLAYLWGVHAVLPSAYPEVQERLRGLGIVICFLFLICGACRLARFNISVNPQPRNPGRPGRKYFVGMPIPAGAGVIAAVVHFELGSPIHDLWLSGVWLALLAFTGFLMVSSWRFWSGKELNFAERQPVRGVLLIVVVLALVIWFSEYALIAIAMAYLLSGVLARLAYSWGRRSTAS
ncbi:CDP-diacylglycerol--serine O-phosphatidyltransferase [Granulicella mallensis]|jgi:CDP-diacylglycerol---serine O-phosphatidyltransferase|uniref:CDP-diacylglycerol--serine O-phosphatidyltransferase n=1 Tax=Granulicella mallensis TaxID=940614 RepID=A0A7W8ECE8_9BACT|nr:CDP-diacylglycerol--serine O-phosphatidyltransferase [Granulicella mallensis]MBB5066631.1 CDP-diacylglycerol--serine O-phosphatidyltransferase [Granulicella mallensis]